MNRLKIYGTGFNLFSDCVPIKTRSLPADAFWSINFYSYTKVFSSAFGSKIKCIAVSIKRRILSEWIDVSMDSASQLLFFFMNKFSDCFLIWMKICCTAIFFCCTLLYTRNLILLKCRYLHIQQKILSINAMFQTIFGWMRLIRKTVLGMKYYQNNNHSTYNF